MVNCGGGPGLNLSSQSPLVVRGITFSNCDGALVIQSDAFTTVDSCAFVDNVGYSAPAGAAFLHMGSSSSSVRVWNSSFIRNQARHPGLGMAYGAAIYQNTFGSVEIRNCSFHDNTVTPL